MKIRSVGPELFHAGKSDRQTDMTKLIVTFRYFATAPKKGDKRNCFIYRRIPPLSSI